MNGSQTNKVQVNCLINGVATDYLTISDRAIHYGDGIFETILCHNNILFYWHQHYQRLLTSAKKLQIACADEQTFLDDIRCLLSKNKQNNNETFVLKIILTRGSSERGYVFEKNITNTTRVFAKNISSKPGIFTKNITSNRLVILSTLDFNYSSLLTGKLSTGELFVCKQQVSINESLAGLKHLNRLENVMARNEWSAAGSDKNNKIADGLMLNANQHVIEGSMSNLFAIKDNQLFTPELSQSGVNGVMRDVIINLLEKNKIQLSIVNINMDELLAMDAIFISNSLIGMKSINKIAMIQYHDNSLLNRIFKLLLNTRDAYAQAL